MPAVRDTAASSSCRRVLQAVSMLLAGYETSANLLAFAVYNLAKQPAKAAKLQAELDSIKGAQHLRQLMWHHCAAASPATGTHCHTRPCRATTDPACAAVTVWLCAFMQRSHALQPYDSRAVCRAGPLSFAAVDPLPYLDGVLKVSVTC